MEFLISKHFEIRAISFFCRLVWIEQNLDKIYDDTCTFLTNEIYKATYNKTLLGVSKLSLREGKKEMGSKAEANLYKAHAICIPSPFQSHVKAMFKFAKLVHHKGLHITFVNTEFNQKRFFSSRGNRISLNCFPGFQFETIPDCLPSSLDENSGQYAKSLCENIKNNILLQPFLDLSTKLNNRSNKSCSNNTESVPPVSCIISDGFMAFTIRAAQELGLPVLMFFTISACSFMGFKQLRTLKDKGLTPVKGRS